MDAEHPQGVKPPTPNMISLLSQAVEAVAPNLYDSLELPQGKIEHFIERRGHNRGGFYIDCHILESGAVLRYAPRLAGCPCLVRLENTPQEGRVEVGIGIDDHPMQILSQEGDTAYLQGADQRIRLRIESSVLCQIRLTVYPQSHHGSPTPHSEGNAA